MADDNAQLIRGMRNLQPPSAERNNEEPGEGHGIVLQAAGRHPAGRRPQGIHHAVGEPSQRVQQLRAILNNIHELRTERDAAPPEMREDYDIVLETLRAELITIRARVTAGAEGGGGNNRGLPMLNRAEPQAHLDDRDEAPAEDASLDRDEAPDEDVSFAGDDDVSSAGDDDVSSTGDEEAEDDVDNNHGLRRSRRGSGNRRVVYAESPLHAPGQEPEESSGNEGSVAQDEGSPSGSSNQESFASEGSEDLLQDDPPAQVEVPAPHPPFGDDDFIVDEDAMEDEIQHPVQRRRPAEIQQPAAQPPVQRHRVEIPQPPPAQHPVQPPAQQQLIPNHQEPQVDLAPPELPGLLPHELEQLPGRGDRGIWVPPETVRDFNNQWAQCNSGIATQLYNLHPGLVNIHMITDIMRLYHFRKAFQTRDADRNQIGHAGMFPLDPLPVEIQRIVQNNEVNGVFQGCPLEIIHRTEGRTVPHPQPMVSSVTTCLSIALCHTHSNKSFFRLVFMFGIKRMYMKPCMLHSLPITVLPLLIHSKRNLDNVSQICIHSGLPTVQV